MKSLLYRALHRMRGIAGRLIFAGIRGPYWRLQGMRIGSGTVFREIQVTWPQQVSIGADCVLEQGVYFKYDGIWSAGPHIVIGDHCFVGAYCEFNISSHLEIGRDALIGSGCKFVDHNHNMARGENIGSLPGASAPIVLGRGAWLGCNVVVLPGVTIGDGAVVGAGAVVTKSIPPEEIWGGVPARRLGMRSAKV